MVTEHGPVPLHALQPRNVKPRLAVAESATTVPWLNIALQAVAVEQSIPAGELVPRPAPFKLRFTRSSRLITAKVAVTVRLVVIGTVQVGVVFEQAPDQPVKVEPPLGFAVRVTLVA